MPDAPPLTVVVPDAGVLQDLNAGSYALCVGYFDSTEGFNEPPTYLTQFQPADGKGFESPIEVQFNLPSPDNLKYFIGFYKKNGDTLYGLKSITPGSLYEIPQEPSQLPADKDAIVYSTSEDSTWVRPKWIDPNGFGVLNRVGVRIVLYRSPPNSSNDWTPNTTIDPATPVYKSYPLWVPGTGLLLPKSVHDLSVWFQNLKFGDDDVEAKDQSFKCKVVYGQGQASRSITYPNDWPTLPVPV
ncbi:hypothetical protein CLAIMM_06748 [Cladophialophora immunda]|nr:hypothetical protein CLAIMM_06748 [Cladophialophora immunda]